MGITDNEDGLRPINSITLFEESRARLRRARSPLHILLVEDDPVTQALVQRMFSERYCVTVCGDVYQAVNEYLRVMPDLVLLDIELGDAEYNGLDVLHTLCMQDPDANIVMVSGNATPENIAKAARGGAYGFIMKPFQFSRLLMMAQECEQLKNG